MKQLLSISKWFYIALFIAVLSSVTTLFLGVNPIVSVSLFSFISCLPFTIPAGSFGMLIKWGAGVVDGRGKLNGWVAAAGKGGAYFRTKVTPSNPKSSFQQNVRGQLAGNAQAWRGLTEEQRAGWNSLAAQQPYRNIFGDQKYISGLSMYTKLNTVLINNGDATIDDAPSFEAIPTVTTLTGAAAEGAGTFTSVFAPSPVPAGMRLVYECTPQVSAGRYNVNSLFRKLGNVDAAGTTPADLMAIGSGYDVRFGALVEGKKIGVRAYFVSKTTGQVGIAQQVNVVVAA